jgi:hypothetical protein
MQKTGAYPMSQALPLHKEASFSQPPVFLAVKAPLTGSGKRDRTKLTARENANPATSPSDADRLLSVIARQRAIPQPQCALVDMENGLAFEIDNISFLKEVIAFRQAFQASATNAPVDMEKVSPAGPNPKQVLKDQGKSILNPGSRNISLQGDAPIADRGTDSK